MTDWSKLKVADLKDECKSRDIPLAGLKLKQQYIDKLREYEAQNGDQSDQAAQEQDAEVVEEQPTPQANGNDSEPHDAEPDVSDAEKEGQLEEDNEEDNAPASEDNVEGENPPAFQEEDSRADKTPANGEEPAAEAQPPIDDAVVKDALFVPEPNNVIERIGENRQEKAGEVEQDTQQASNVEMRGNDDESTTTDQIASSQKPAISSTPQSAGPPSETSTPRTSRIPSNDLAEDQRIRRKRSATPIPSTEEVARKKARLSEEDKETRPEEALGQMKAATETASDVRGEPTNGEPLKAVIEGFGDGALATESLSIPQNIIPMESEAKEPIPSTSPPGSRSPSEERDIPPAIHPATSSLYIRNFKRPLQLPLLRSHIISKAKSRSSDDSDPITTIYLDGIRTHAFVSFTSVTAASRVRSAMHGARFPDEPHRDLLSVDYVPDNKVQSWIDEETGSGFGRGGSTRRLFEVVYEEGPNGVEAIFQEADTTRPRPPLELSRTSRMSFDRQHPDSVHAGAHPDRAVLVLRDDRDRDRERPRVPPTGPKNSSSSNNGTGFKALDELFNSTTAKPKLYYKPAPASVATERLDMFRDLKVGHGEMGRSGDEGMKRYTFDRAKDREEWIDKGPEFGFGRRGQDRLVGADRGGRGRRGGYRGRPVDSWRGGGR